MVATAEYPIHLNNGRKVAAKQNAHSATVPIIHCLDILAAIKQAIIESKVTVIKTANKM